MAQVVPGFPGCLLPQQCIKFVGGHFRHGKPVEDILTYRGRSPVVCTHHKVSPFYRIFDMLEISVLQKVQVGGAQFDVDSRCVEILWKDGPVGIVEKAVGIPAPIAGDGPASDRWRRHRRRQGG